MFFDDERGPHCGVAVEPLVQFGEPTFSQPRHLRFHLPAQSAKCITILAVQVRECCDDAFTIRNSLPGKSLEHNAAVQHLLTTRLANRRPSGSPMAFLRHEQDFHLHGFLMPSLRKAVSLAERSPLDHQLMNTVLHATACIKATTTPEDPWQILPALAAADVDVMELLQGIVAGPPKNTRNLVPVHHGDFSVCILTLCQAGGQ